MAGIAVPKLNLSKIGVVPNPKAGKSGPSPFAPAPRPPPPPSARQPSVRVRPQQGPRASASTRNRGTAPTGGARPRRMENSVKAERIDCSEGLVAAVMNSPGRNKCARGGPAAPDRS